MNDKHTEFVLGMLNKESIELIEYNSSIKNALMYFIDYCPLMNEYVNNGLLTCQRTKDNKSGYGLRNRLVNMYNCLEKLDMIYSLISIDETISIFKCIDLPITIDVGSVVNRLCYDIYDLNCKEGKYNICINIITKTPIFYLKNEENEEIKDGEPIIILPPCTLLCVKVDSTTKIYYFNLILTQTFFTK